MDRRHVCQILAVAATIHTAVAVEAPTNLVSCTGDKSIVLHWDPVGDPTLSGYNVYRSLNSTGPFVLQNTSLLTSPGFCDLFVSDGETNLYEVTAVDADTGEGLPSAPLVAAANSFTNNDQFWITSSRPISITFGTAANPANGLVPDRSADRLGLQHRGGGIRADRHRYCY